MTRRALAMCCLSATLAACATTDREAQSPAPPAEAQAPGATGASPAPRAKATAPARIVKVPGPPAADFVGKPVADLEALIGEPALVRREGPTEFRRYDVTDDCRAYVVASADRTAVLSLSTGPAIQGGRAPAFEDCTATEGFVGS